MNKKQSVFGKALGSFVLFSLLCGVVYPGVVTGIAQAAFPEQANGSLIEINGQVYGCALLGQQFTKDCYMQGRVMNLDVSTFTTDDGEALVYAGPSNKSPASEEFADTVAQRVAAIQAANPAMEGVPVPVDLVTCSGSGLDPQISLAAAMYQAARIAEARDMSQDDVVAIIDQCTEGKFLGVFGEKTVNVLKVNLMLDGILETAAV